MTKILPKRKDFIFQLANWDNLRINVIENKEAAEIVLRKMEVLRK